MIHYFKNVNNETVEIDKPENGIWVNLVPPFKEEEFFELGE
jgi:magnesium transporter